MILPLVFLLVPQIWMTKYGKHAALIVCHSHMHDH